MRVGVVRGGMEVEIWKRAHREGKAAELIKDADGNKIIRAGNQPTKIMQPVATAVAA